MIAAFRSMRALGRHWKLTGIAAFSLASAMALGIVGLSVSHTLLALPPPAPAPDRLAGGRRDAGALAAGGGNLGRPWIRVDPMESVRHA